MCCHGAVHYVVGRYAVSGCEDDWGDALGSAGGKKAPGIISVPRAKRDKMAAVSREKKPHHKPKRLKK